MRCWLTWGVLVLAAGVARGAPELLVNGGGDRPLAAGWSVLSGSAMTTGLIDGGGLGVLAPCEGFGFVALGAGSGDGAVTQSGSYPFGSDRLFWRGHVRAPQGGTLRATIEAVDDVGDVLIASSVEIAPGGAGWTDVSLTYAIPSLAEEWTLTLEASDAGAVGVHADAMSLIGTCLADFNGDRVLNFFDLSDYIVAFLAGDPNADLTGNGVIDFFDIRELVDSFEFDCD